MQTPTTTIRNLETPLLPTSIADANLAIPENNARNTSNRTCKLILAATICSIAGLIIAWIKQGQDVKNDCPNNQDHESDRNCETNKQQQAYIFGAECATGGFILMSMYLYRQSISDRLKFIPSAAAHCLSSIQMLCPTTNEDEDIIVPLPEGGRISLHGLPDA